MSKMAEGGDVAANATRMFQQHVATTSETIFSQTIDLIELKFCRKVPMVLKSMHVKNYTIPMHESRGISKMDEGDNVDFLKNNVPV